MRGGDLGAWQAVLLLGGTLGAVAVSGKACWLQCWVAMKGRAGWLHGWLQDWLQHGCVRELGAEVRG